MNTPNLSISRNYPNTRLRRLRQKPWLRSMLTETRLHPSDLIMPIFVSEEDYAVEVIDSLPGTHRWGVERLPEICVKAHQSGITCVALFPCVAPAKKDAVGSEALNSNNTIVRAVRKIRSLSLDMGIIVDVALDPYTTHGHDGVLDEYGDVDNDKTVDVLTTMSLILCRAGADILAPSDMQDGRIGAIRQACEKEGYPNIILLSYAIKFASSFYGPFRHAVGSYDALGGADKRTYQQNPANISDCYHEAALDVSEGADMLMVKPGLAYLDVIHQISTSMAVPVIAYQVSGEYQLIFPTLASLDDPDRQAILLESLLSMKRSGAQAIVTYAALTVASSLQG